MGRKTNKRKHIMNTVTIEKYKRGFFGQIIKWIFILFNVLMIIWLISYFVTLGKMPAGSNSEAETVGKIIGGTLGTGILVFFWAIGDIVLGMLTFFTRGNKVITTIIKQDK
jgi:hypothetical protein